MAACKLTVMPCDACSQYTKQQKHQYPDANYYWQGRFSTGPSSVELFADATHLQLLDYCYGFSTACKANSDTALIPGIPDLQQQVAAFKDTHSVAAASAASGNASASTSRSRLISVAAGSNDYLQKGMARDVIQRIQQGKGSYSPTQDVPQVVGCISAALRQLALATGGERLDIVVSGLPPLEVYGLLRGSPAAATALAAAVRLHNSALEQAVKGLQAEFTGGSRVRFLFYDQAQGGSSMVTSAALQGYHFASPCYVLDKSSLTVESACTNPERYVALDTAGHPGQFAVKWSAEKFQSFVKSNGLL